eukprot:755023-Hanusia_phi.AAC.2
MPAGRPSAAMIQGFGSGVGLPVDSAAVQRLQSDDQGAGALGWSSGPGVMRPRRRMQPGGGGERGRRHGPAWATVCGARPRRGRMAASVYGATRTVGPRRW